MTGRAGAGERERSIGDLIGDYRAFFDDQVRRLSGIGIDVEGLPLSHLAFRAGTHEEYLAVRDGIEAWCRANVENVWDGRPISKLQLAKPLPLGTHHSVDLIELIPPVHRPEHPLGLEHVGFVVGDDYEAFAERHRTVLTGIQDQGPISRPLFVTFENSITVKFHRISLHDVVVEEGGVFEGFHHVVAG